MSEYLAERRKANASRLTKITAEEAARRISQSTPFESNVPFDTDEASRLGVKFGDVVSIVPEDNGMSDITVFLVTWFLSICSQLKSSRRSGSL